ncbi:hypothetical protein ACFRCG_03780 [Embleya sp. NPDC056575]|uniref:hypothetical protein n=1 Tax=unclassified Embleya TaxID=2699296 RepID=UPI00368261F3
MPQPLVRTLVPVHEPLVEQVLQPGDAEARLTFDIRATPAGVGAGVSRKVSAEQGVDRSEGALHDALAVGANGGAGWTPIPNVSQAAVNAPDTKTFP